ncbi:MAG: AtpZ/AtpI family protein [Gammaproteobacteria bacterium]
MDGKRGRKLEKATQRIAERMRQAEKNRPTLFAQTAFLSSLAVMFVLPVVIGAYLGRWIDGLFEGYSVRWTVSLIVLGVAAGIVNVYLFIKGRP